MEEGKTERRQLSSRLRNNLIEAIGGDREEKVLEDLKRRLIISVIFTVPLLAGTWLQAEAPWWIAVQAVLLIPILVMNINVFLDGFASIRKKKPEKNTLAAIGSIAALLMLQFATAGLFLTTMALCRCSEAYVNCKLDDHLKQLIEAEPEDPGKTPGEIITVGKGERFPADGEILTGSAIIEEELITGDRIPAEKGPGEPAFAGTRVLTGNVELRILRSGEETTISRIIEHITSSIATRPPMAARTDRSARILVLAVVVLAFCSMLIWFASGRGLLEAVMTAVSILIIANPYALTVAVPMSILGGVVKGAKNGILIRSADILELARDINTIAMNKTGTVTAGKPEISDMIRFSDGFSLQIAGALEKEAHHPVGQAIRRAAEERYGAAEDGSGKGLPEATDLRFMPGQGVQAVVNGAVWLGGSAKLMEENGVATNLPEAEPLFAQGKSVVFFSTGGRVSGIIALRDAPKPVSMKAISRIEGMGIDTVMLTGDSRKTAEAIRSEVGIDRIFAGIRQAEKARIIEALREGGETMVGMVGDGLDDAEPIAMADIGIAIGAGPAINVKTASMIPVSMASEVYDKSDEEAVAAAAAAATGGGPAEKAGGPANETAGPVEKTSGPAEETAGSAHETAGPVDRSPDVILIADDLMDVVRAIGLSRKTMRFIRQDIGFAWIYNVLAIAAAASVLIPLAGPVMAPAAASLCMCASQILVVASTLRMKSIRL